MRIVENEDIAEFFFYDCKKNYLRGSRWFELIERIASDISSRFQISIRDCIFTERSADDSFVKLIKRIKGNKRIVLVFDEIDFISPNAKRNSHWKSDFLEFWQTMWACQSEARRILFFIAGVNPYPIETPYVDGDQNPIFQIVPYKYLKGLSIKAVKNMITSLSSKMGMTFSEESICYIYNRYGGHPLLTRMACSEIFQNNKNRNHEFPVTISDGYLQELGEYWDMSIVTYCSHIVYELRESYPEEYELLKHLAFNRIKEYISATRFSDKSKHLEGYGLVEVKNQMPRLSLPVVEKYIKLDDARTEGRKTILRLVQREKRDDWLRSILAKITTEVRNIYKEIDSELFKAVFSHGTIPEADLLLRMAVCDDQDDFNVFINKLYRSFAEPIELYGKKIKANNFFFNEFKEAFPELFVGIHRIKVYRNNEKHLALNPMVEEALKKFINQDLEGQNPNEIDDLYFALQQCTMEGLLNALVLENVMNIK
jgi:hypothetical protein